jgi:hypothetical protein
MKDDFEKGLEPEEATARIHEIANSCRVNLKDTVSAVLGDGLIMSDILHALRNGEVTAPGVKSTMCGIFKYVIECRTPNHPDSSLKLAIIISKSNWVKVCEIL